MHVYAIFSLYFLMIINYNITFHILTLTHLSIYNVFSLNNYHLYIIEINQQIICLSYLNFILFANTLRIIQIYRYIMFAILNDGI